MSTLKIIKRINILGIPIDILKFNDALKKINHFIQSSKYHQVATVNPEFIIEAQKNKKFKKVLLNTSLSTVDGHGILFALWFLKNIKLWPSVTGVDLFWAIAKLAEDKKYKIFLLGGGPGIAKRTAKRIKIVHPQINIVGTYPGSTKETKHIIKMINKAQPNILFVAWGAPKQEVWIYDNSHKFKNPLVAMGVGGTFDFIVGEQIRAPKWMRKLGLEWLYRLIKEPKRYKRIYNAVIKFPALVIWDTLKR